jgi:phosphoribosylformylglycinamidine cyclo-ligase
MADLAKDSGKDSGAQGVTYASAGVDIEAGDRAVEPFKPLASKATRPEVRSKLGGFAGLFALRSDYREPMLAASGDGVGTKLAVAARCSAVKPPNTPV